MKVKRILAGVIAAVMLLMTGSPVLAETAEAVEQVVATANSSDSDFLIDENGVLTGYTGAGGDVVIPDGVTSIGYQAFAWCSSLTNITIPNSVTSIGSRAFFGCSSLTSITISNSIKSIESQTFYGCSSLTDITIPNSVTSIEYSAFHGCISLTSITIPNSVTSIGYWAFYDCSSLTSITISDSVMSIGEEAFRDCISLTSITIPDSVTSIENNAFFGCSSLTNIDVSKNNSVYYSHDGVLYNKAYQKVLVCPEGKSGDYYIPDGVMSIGDWAFYECSSLTSITIPNSVTSIGWEAFCGCSSLTSITIPNSVTSIGNGAFAYCSSLTSVTIPDGVTSIGDSAFCYCSSLTNITIPDGVTNIGACAFYECSNLTSIMIPNSVTNIGWETFYDCGGLTSVYFKGNAPTIESDCFRGVTATAYYPIGNTTWTDDVKQDYGGTITWVKWDSSGGTEEPKDDDWVIFVDNNSFGHPDNYKIDSMYFNKLVEGETKGVRNSIQAKINKQYVLPEVFPGSCMGMSAVVALIKTGKIDIKDIDKNKTNCFALDYQIDDNGNLTGTLKNLVNYYQLTQSVPSGKLKGTSACLGFFSQSKVKDILKRIVTLASNEKKDPFLLHINFDKKTIDTKTNKEKIINAGHALIVCGYEHKDGKHVLKLVDPNVINEFVYFTIPEDYDLSKCVLSNAAGYRLVKLTGVGYQELSSLDRFALTSKEIQGTSTKKTSEPIETILRASTAYPFTVVNASGQTLTYDGEDFSGDMEVKNFNIISNDGIEAPSMMNIEVSNSDTFTVTFPEEVEFEVIADKMYAGVQATGTDKIVFSAESGIEMTGKNIMQTTYLTMNNEYVDMISVSGDVGNSMTLKQNGADIAMNAQEMDEVVVSSFKDVEKQEQTVESATDSIVISGDETGIAVEEGTATIKGDLTGDGKADISDLMMLAQVVNGRTALTAEQSTAADVTGDGKADIADLMKLAQFVNGKIDTLDE